MDNPYASQFEFRPAATGGPFVQMFDKRTNNDLVWTGHYSLAGRPVLDDPPPGRESLMENPHMRLIADTLNEAVKPLNEALRRV